MARHMRHRILVISAVAAGVGLLAGCKNNEAKSVHVMGSTSVLPYAQELGQAYEKQHPDCKVNVDGGGTAAGIKAVEDGLADIGTCSRELTTDEAAKFQQVIIARDGLAIIVNKDNPVSELTTEQVKKIFAGEIKNWKEVGGTDGEIVAVTREEGSGTRECFQHLIMGKEGKIAKALLTQESTGAVKEVVKGNVRAIAYMSLGLVGGEAKMLKLDGQEPSSAGVLAGTYKLARPFLFITKGAPKEASKAFIDYVLSDEAQAKLEKEGLTRAKSK